MLNRPFVRRSARRPVPSLAVALPLGLAAGAILEPFVWPVALPALAIGFGWLLHREAPARWLWAALIPLVLRVAFAETFPEPRLPADLSTCGDLLSPIALRRLAEAVLVLGSLALLAALLHADRASLGLRWPSRAVGALSLAMLLVVVPLALVLGPLLARPFFGEYRLELGFTVAILPALLFALANATAEEALYRGAIQGWGARAVGVNGALVAQAALFGLAHGGVGYLEPLAALPVMVAIGAGGLLAGLIVRRTGSLLLPIVIHVALDVPLYYALACRLST